MTTGDLDAVAALEPVLFGRGAWSRRSCAEELALPTRYYVVAEVEGEVIGYAGADLAEEAQVMTVGVAPGHRRRGVAGALLERLLEAARGAGARTVLLEVRADDAGAQRLYARHGFEPIGLRRGYYQHDGQDAVVMRLTFRRGPGPVGREAIPG